MLDFLASTPLSSGGYGHVSSTWIPNVVLKESTDDPAWAYWIAFCIQFQDESPVLPRVHLMHCDPDGKNATVIMEELDHDYNNAPTIVDTLQDDYIVLRLPDEVQSTFALFLSFVRSETRPGISFRFDGHCCNWMFRKEQLVLTDPVAGELHYRNPSLFQHPRIKCPK